MAKIVAPTLPKTLPTPLIPQAQQVIFKLLYSASRNAFGKKNPMGVAREKIMPKTAARRNSIFMACISRKMKGRMAIRAVCIIRTPRPHRIIDRSRSCNFIYFAKKLPNPVQLSMMPRITEKVSVGLPSKRKKCCNKDSSISMKPNPNKKKTARKCICIRFAPFNSLRLNNIMGVNMRRQIQSPITKNN